MRTLKTLYLTNAREFLREPMALFLVLLLPVVLAVFFGLVFGGDSGYSFVPNVLGIALVWLGLFGTAMPVAQQREGQVLRRLGVTPLSPVALLTGQVAWRLTVAIIQTALFLIVGYIAFGVTVEGDWLLFAGAVALGALVFICLGYFLASVFRSTEGTIAALQLVNFPLMFLSGSLFPVESLPSYFRPVVDVMPLTYLSDALRQLIIGAPPLYPLWLDFAVMSGWLVVLVVLTARCWRWE
jgi:ABC-2 type transport system permease protein